MHLPPKARSWIVIGLAAGLFLVAVSMGPSSLRAAVTREEVERAIREGVRFLKQEQRADGSWADVHGEARTGTTSLVTLALLDRRREARLADRPQGPRLPARLRARPAQQHLRDRAPDDGLRRRRARARSAPDRRQRELARVGPDQAGRPRPLAGLVDLLQLEASPARRQLEHPVRPARPERRQRGRRAGQARGLGPGASLLGAVPEARRELGLHARLGGLDGQHDLRGDLQPDHHRAEAVPGPGVPPGRA